ncbi:MAG: hypothetical protein IPM69_06085 [Ignavibacteria bacterium]|nr:hypothetical protein [Ignavibacteria bacterium]
MKKNYVLTLLLVGAVILVGCPEEVVKPLPIDPCVGKAPITAAFTIADLSGSDHPFWVKYDCDTVLNSSVLFEAKVRNADSYEWTIGSQTITTRDVIRGNFPRGEQIPIRLIVRKKPDTTCFPSDDGIDTVVRLLYTVPIVDDPGTLIHRFDSPRGGRFKGVHDDSPNDTLTITIDPYYFTQPDRTVYAILDFPKKGCICWQIGGHTNSYKEDEFAYSGNNDCMRPSGISYIHGKNNDSLLIHYRVNIVDSSGHIPVRPERKFRGVRIL